MMTYMEITPEYIISDMIDEIILESTTITEKATRTKYIMVGAGFDIETSLIELDKEIYGISYTSYCYHWQFGLGNETFAGRSLETMYDFLVLLNDSIKNNKGKSKLLVLDANLGYEWQFCKHYWAEMGITKLFAKEKRNPILIEVDYSIQFREVIGLFGKSLAHIAKNYCNIEKLVGDLDYDKVRLSNTELTELEMSYCERDVRILVELATNHIFKNFMGSNPRLPYTGTGIVRDAIKRELGKDLKKEREKISSWMPSEEDYELFRNYLFKGGISGCNIMHMKKTFNMSNGNPVKGADITSDYPYQMLTKLFPMGKAVVDSNENFCSTNKPYIGLIEFHRFRTKSTHALMSAHKALNSKEMIKSENTILDNNRIQYAEKVILCINDIEFKSLKKAYKWSKAYCLKCWVFNDGYKKLPQHILKVTLKQYLIKQSLKAEHSDSLDYKQAKEFVNSIFGMMCTALYREEWKFFADECDIKVEEDENNNKVLTSYEECCKYLFLSPYWGFWITSYAREMLMDVIVRFPKIIVQYDTDSVYYITGNETANKLEEYLDLKNSQIKLLNNTLFHKEPLMETIGTWDFTKPFLRFKGLGAKRYMYEYLDKKCKAKIKVVVTGCRTVNDPTSEYNGKSTLLLQCDKNNSMYGTNIDPFDFFDHKMLIDKESSNKLASYYIEKEIVVDYTDDDGNTEEIRCKSAVVLRPIEFQMTLKKKHLALHEIAQRYSQNSTDWGLYNVWRKLKKLNI